MKTDRKELELYLHIPFCVRKCLYCDFLSAPADEEVRSAYMRQMHKEMDMLSPDYQNYRISSVFIGGGTPSLLSGSQIQRLMERVQSCFTVLADAEITMECNPGTADADKMRACFGSGINRLSFGLQSADAGELKLLGRIHTFEQFMDNYELARNTGFENINIDLMSALPGQKVSVYEQTVQKILALRPEHISSYSLMIEEGTPFYERYSQAQILREKGKSQHLLPTEEEERRMYVLTKELLKSEGYDRYEISNYALDGFACRHNTGYWMRKNYLGIGLGAASLVENERFSNTSDLKEYLEADFAKKPGVSGDRQQLTVREQMEEFVFLGLRMMRGISAEKFRRQFFTSLEDVYGEVIKRQLQDGFIKETTDGYCLTDYGIDISNYVMAQYLAS